MSETANPVSIDDPRYDVRLIDGDDAVAEAAMRFALSGTQTSESGHDAVAALRAVAIAQQLRTDKVVAAFRDGMLMGAALAIETPGRSAMLHCKVGQEYANANAVIPRLVTVLKNALFAQGTLLVQVLLNQGDGVLAPALRASGFRYLTELVYMNVAVAQLRTQRRSLDSVRISTYEPAREAAFLRALDATYLDSLDCPGLTGLRATEDVLAGHRATGVFDPQGWYVLENGEDPVGVLLTAQVPRTRTLEIVYIGVARDHRGKSVGKYLMELARQRAQQLALRNISLALDATNEPARRLYDRCGFRATQRRRVWISTPEADAI